MIDFQELVQLDQNLNEINFEKELVLDFNLSKNKTVTLEDGVNYIVSLENFTDDCTLDLASGKNNKILLNGLVDKSIKNARIAGKIMQNSVIFCYFADFTSSQFKALVRFELVEENASIFWHLSSLSATNDNKEFDVSVIHKHPSTFARVENYGVCKDNGRLIFSGESSIEKGCSGSKSHQNAKIMVFNEESVAKAKPVLKIDENDIEASHAAVVGRINEEHLFYLTSRGLSEANAKQLITYGYLKPILKGFLNDDVKNKINSLIERRM